MLRPLQHVLALAKLGHQVEDPDADRDVEHRHRLVGDDQLRTQAERLREPDPLALPAAHESRADQRPS